MLTQLGVCFRREVGVTSHENRKTYRHPETPSGDLLPGKTPREVAGSFWCLVGTKWEVLILALLTTPRQVGGEPGGNLVGSISVWVSRRRKNNHNQSLSEKASYLEKPMKLLYILKRRRREIFDYPAGGGNVGSFVARFLTNSPGLGEDFFSQFWVNSPRGGGKSCGDLFTQSGDLVGSTYRHQESAYSHPYNGPIDQGCLLTFSGWGGLPPHP